MLFRKAFAIVVLSLFPGYTLFANKASVTEANEIAALETRLIRLERMISGRGLLDLLQQVEDLKSEIGDLRGQIEVQRHQLDQLKGRQRRVLSDVDRRIQRMESIGEIAKDNNRTLEAIGTDTDVDRERTGELNIQVVTMKTGVTNQGDNEEKTLELQAKPTTDVSAQPERAQADSLRAQADYQQAFKLLKQANYDQAIKAFSEYLENYPASQYSDNAQYWLGETFYATRKFDKAINAYQRLIDNYPESRKAAHGMLKLGFSYQELGNLSEAKKQLEEVRNRFPGSTAARLADERLRVIKTPDT